jgi:hypothetical protein
MGIAPLSGRAAQLAAGRPVLDCALIGGGQFGLTIAFGLARERVARVQVFDANPPGQAGPWMTFARMDMLRTPKNVGGHELGIPSLSFRAWYEAQYGCAGWEQLDRIPRPLWMAYLNWYRETLGLAVQSETRLTALDPLGDELFILTLEHCGATQTVLARTVVLATGAEGSGDRVIPEFITRAVPPHLRAQQRPDRFFGVARQAHRRAGCRDIGFRQCGDGARSGGCRSAPVLPASDLAACESASLDGKRRIPGALRQLVRC